MINIQSLSHRYANAQQNALSNISLQIQAGECWGLLGHNGAGKTTLMSLLAGLQEVQTGDVFLNGKPFRDLSRVERQKIGLVPQDFAFYPQLSVWDNMRFFASLYRERDANWLQHLLAKADLLPYQKQAAKNLSGGLKRRLNFAIGLINRPEILYLDEITVGIDPQSRRFILDSVQEQIAAGVTVIYTSHYLNEIETLCSKIALLNAGELVYQGKISDLLQQDAQQVRFVCETMPSAVQTQLTQQFALQSLGQGQFAARLNPEQAAALYRNLMAENIKISHFQQGYGSLESFYLDFLRKSEA
ncbi:MAG: ABC transporter ATP-binding protein [Neisseria sp.]|nr:ABC transporter ATP-binding protein [Neisseria sp.]